MYQTTRCHVTVCSSDVLSQWRENLIKRYIGFYSAFRRTTVSPFNPRPRLDRFHSTCLCIKSLTWHQNCRPAVNIVNLAFNLEWTVWQRSMRSSLRRCNLPLGLTSFLPFSRQWTVSSFSSVAYFTGLSIYRIYSIHSRIINEWWIGKDLKGSIRDLIDALLRNLPGVIKKSIKHLRQ
jgi:hypothetical protein